jgi:hypothetical protein
MPENHISGVVVNVLAVVALSVVDGFPSSGIESE